MHGIPLNEDKEDKDDKDDAKEIAIVSAKRQFDDCLNCITGGDLGIRTLDAGLSPHASLAGKCLRPLGQVSTLFLLPISYRLRNLKTSIIAACLLVVKKNQA